MEFSRPMNHSYRFGQLTEAIPNLREILRRQQRRGVLNVQIREESAPVSLVRSTPVAFPALSQGSNGSHRPAVPS